MSDVLQSLHDKRLAVGRRLVDHMRDNTSDLADEPMRNSPSVYTDPVRFEAERQKLFRETPLVACMSSDLPSPGSYRLFDETGVPVVIVRGRDGQVRAFLNVCTHRGARLVREEAGKANTFTCWFHGWSFDNQGKMRGALQAERFGDCLSERDHLVEMPAGERHGLVFVQTTPGSTMDLDAHLGGFAAELEILELGKAERVKSGPLTVKSNWKFALDTYGELYHIGGLHRKTLAPYFRHDICVYNFEGPHFRLIGPERSMEAWVDQPEEEWDTTERLGGIHYIFPNTIIFAGKVKPGFGFYTMFRHFPDAVGQTTTHQSIYAPGGVLSEDYRKEVEQSFDDTRYVVENEDYVVSAEGYRNLQYLPADSTLVYGRQEQALQHIHRAIAARIGMPLVEAQSGCDIAVAAE